MVKDKVYEEIIRRAKKGLVPLYPALIRQPALERYRKEELARITREQKAAQKRYEAELESARRAERRYWRRQAERQKEEAEIERLAESRKHIGTWVRVNPDGSTSGAGMAAFSPEVAKKRGYKWGKVENGTFVGLPSQKPSMSEYLGFIKDKLDKGQYDARPSVKKSIEAELRKHGVTHGVTTPYWGTEGAKVDMFTAQRRSISHAFSKGVKDRIAEQKETEKVAAKAAVTFSAADFAALQKLEENLFVQRHKKAMDTHFTPDLTKQGQQLGFRVAGLTAVQDMLSKKHEEFGKGGWTDDERMRYNTLVGSSNVIGESVKDAQQQYHTAFRDARYAYNKDVGYRVTTDPTGALKFHSPSVAKYQDLSAKFHSAGAKIEGYKYVPGVGYYTTADFKALKERFKGADPKDFPELQRKETRTYFEAVTPGALTILGERRREELMGITRPGEEIKPPGFIEAMRAPPKIEPTPTLLKRAVTRADILVSGILPSITKPVVRPVDVPTPAPLPTPPYVGVKPPAITRGVALDVRGVYEKFREKPITYGLGYIATRHPILATETMRALQYKPPAIIEYEKRIKEPTQLTPGAEAWSAKLDAAKTDVEFERAWKEGEKKFLTTEVSPGGERFFKEQYIKEIPPPTAEEIQRSVLEEAKPLPIIGRRLEYPIIGAAKVIDMLGRGLVMPTTFAASMKKEIPGMIERGVITEKRAGELEEYLEGVIRKKDVSLLPPTRLAMTEQDISKAVEKGLMTEARAVEARAYIEKRRRLVTIGAVEKAVVTLPTIPFALAGLGLTAVARPRIAPAYLTYTAKEMAKYGIKHPFEFGLTWYMAGPMMRVAGAPIKPITTTIRGVPIRLRGIRPHIGEPSIIGKIRGKKYHPTLDAKPFIKRELRPEIFEKELRYYHGTTQAFLEKIKKESGVEVAPGELVTAYERGLFFSAPKRPYTAFAGPSKMVRVKAGDVTPVVRGTYAPKGAKPKTLIEIPFDVYAKYALKTIKEPSAALKALIEKQKALSGEIALAKVPAMLPREITELRGALKQINEQIQYQAIKELGVKTKVFEKPGAFLELVAKPKKPTPALVKMVLELEKLIDKMEKGTKAERALAAKYKEVADTTRWVWRFKRVAPKYRIARELIRIKKKEIMTATELSRMKLLKKNIEELSKKEIIEASEKGTLVVPPKGIAGLQWKGISEWEYIITPRTELYPVTGLISDVYAKFGIEKGAYKIYDPISERYAQVLKVSTEAPRGYMMRPKMYKEPLKVFTSQEIGILKRLQPLEAERYIAGHKLVKFLSEENISIKRPIDVNFAEIPSIPMKSAPAIKQFFAGYKGEYRFYGSTVERTRLGKVMDIPGDIDVAIANPRVVATQLANIIQKTSGRKTKVKPYEDPTGKFGGTRYEISTQVKGEWVTAFDVTSLRGHLTDIIAGKYRPLPTTSVGVTGILMEQIGEQLSKRASTVFQPGVKRRIGEIGPEAAGRKTRMKDIPKFEAMAVEMIRLGKETASKSKLKKYAEAEEWLEIAMGRKRGELDTKAKLKSELRIISKEIKPTVKPIVDLSNIQKRYQTYIEREPKKLTAIEHERVLKYEREVADIQKTHLKMVEAGSGRKASRSSQKQRKAIEKKYTQIRRIREFRPKKIIFRRLPIRAELKIRPREKLIREREIRIRDERIPPRFYERYRIPTYRRPREERIIDRVRERQSVRVRDIRERAPERVPERPRERVPERIVERVTPRRPPERPRERIVPTPPRMIRPLPPIIPKPKKKKPIIKFRPPGYFAYLEFARIKTPQEIISGMQEKYYKQPIKKRKKK